MTFPRMGVWFPRQHHFKTGSPVIDASTILQGPPAVGDAIAFVVQAPKAGRLNGFAYHSHLLQDATSRFLMGLHTVDAATGLPNVASTGALVPFAALTSSGWNEHGMPGTLEVTAGQYVAVSIEVETAGALTVYGFRYILGQATNWLTPYVVRKTGGVWTKLGTAETCPMLALKYHDGTYGVPFSCFPTQARAEEVGLGSGNETGFAFSVPWSATVDGLSWLVTQTSVAGQAAPTLTGRLYDANRVLLREGPAHGPLTMFEQDAEWFPSYFEPVAIDAGATYYAVLLADGVGASDALHNYRTASAAILEATDGGAAFTYAVRTAPIGPFLTESTRKIWGAIHLGDVASVETPGAPGLAPFFNPCPPDYPAEPAAAVGQLVSPAGVSGVLGRPTGCGEPFTMTPCDPTYPADPA